MVTIKQYANGRYYNTDNKEYVKKEDLAKMLTKKRKIKIIDSKTQKDITKQTVSRLSKSPKITQKTSTKQAAIKNWLDDNKQWISKNLDTRINKILGAMNLPTKDQVTSLTSHMDQLRHKVVELEQRQAQKMKEIERKHTQQIKEMKKNQALQVQQIEKAQESAKEEIPESKETTKS